MKKIYIIVLLACQLFAQDFYNSKEISKDIMIQNRFNELNKTINKVINEDKLTQLKSINEFFNRVSYQRDIIVWGKEDYLANEIEFLRKDMGDSEDFAFAKYMVLIKYLNFDLNHLKLIEVEEQQFKEKYTILAYYASEKETPYILDYRNYKVLKAEKRVDLVPLETKRIVDGKLN